MNSHVRDTFRIRTKVVQYVRRFLDERDFLEVGSSSSLYVLCGGGGGGGGGRRGGGGTDFDVVLRSRFGWRPYCCLRLMSVCCLKPALVSLFVRAFELACLQVGDAHDGPNRRRCRRQAVPYLSQRSAPQSVYAHRPGALPEGGYAQACFAFTLSGIAERMYVSYWMAFAATCGRRHRPRLRNRKAIPQ